MASSDLVSCLAVLVGDKSLGTLKPQVFHLRRGDNYSLCLLGPP